MSEDMKRFVVEGAWLDGNDGSPVTRDFVVAENEDAAVALVEKVRGQTEEWQSDAVMTFERFIEDETAILARMAVMTLEDVEASWAETKANLYYEEDDDDAADDDADEPAYKLSTGVRFWISSTCNSSGASK